MDRQGDKITVVVFVGPHIAAVSVEKRPEGHAVRQCGQCSASILFYREALKAMEDREEDGAVICLVCNGCANKIKAEAQQLEIPIGPDVALGDCMELIS